MPRTCSDCGGFRRRVHGCIHCAHMARVAAGEVRCSDVSHRHEGWARARERAEREAACPVV